MLKSVFNEAHLKLDITTCGPLLVKTGYATVIGADMAPVQSYRNGRKEIYLPATSLKGIFRSHSEKVINSIRPKVACNPFQGPNDVRDNLYNTFCGRNFKNEDSSQKVYAGSCPTCRLFGSTEFAGRLAVQDAYLVEEDPVRTLTEHRDGVGIDRLTGGAKSQAKFDMEVVTADVTFSTTLHLRNFEIWQLGLLFVLIQDMEDELIRVGFGRSRGLGKVTAHISEREEGAHQGGLILSTTRTGQQSREPDREVWGFGPWLGDEAILYGTKRDDVLTLSNEVSHMKHGIRYLRVFKGDALEDLREQCLDNFVARIQTWEQKQPAARVQQER